MPGILKPDNSDIPTIILRSLKGTLTGICITAVLALILPAVILRFDDPDSITAPLAYVTLALGALSCGIAVRKHGAVPSLISGVGFVICLWLVSAASGTDGGGIGLLWKLIGYACCIGISVLGGTVGKGKKRHPGEGKKSPAALLRRQLDRRQ